jgi:hypothetical protein
LRFVLFVAALFLAAPASAQGVQQTKGDFQDKFRQLDEVLPTPNTYRNASGAPGHQYWQQKVDYKITATLDEAKRRITARATVRYTNNSPDALPWLWMQLDQNIFKKDSMAELTDVFGGAGRRGPKVTLGAGSEPTKLSFDELRRQQAMADNAYGYDIGAVKTLAGATLPHTIVGTLMRVDLPEPLAPGATTEFSIEWAFNIVEEDAVVARSGYEHFPDDPRKGGNDIFLLAQWFPRMVVYSDYEGWHNKEFLGRGEFTLEFGDYEVEMTVPDDHVVASTGTLQNPDQVLTAAQRQRLETAKNAAAPTFIVTPAEAAAAEAGNPKGSKTWKFAATNVRDFAWASSRKFLWDAQGVKQPGAENETVLAMSFWPKEGGELWRKYSTAAIVHTLKVYSRFSFDYPYPTAQSINGPVGGMEYPMITFNGPRTILNKDGTRTYTLAAKMGLIGVVIHEVGHIYFPMTVNSDERQWTWMDEGLNSFLDSVAGYEWDPNLPWSRSIPRDLTSYMVSSNQQPIMTQSDSITDLGSNAYGKPAAALHLLRDTVIGRERFDFAFKEYARRWKFKRPTPADFFRTMEEASGTDLDWFWRGWFYTTDHVDISLESIYRLKMDSKNPDIDLARRRKEREEEPDPVGIGFNQKQNLPVWVLENPGATDFYDKNDQFTVTPKDKKGYTDFLEGLAPWERAAFDRAVKEDANYYVLNFTNKGGLVMPIILGLTFQDGSKEKLAIPAEIWRRNAREVAKLLVYPKGKELVQVMVDPDWETGDADLENNHYPRRIIPSRIEAFKDEASKSRVSRDLMGEAAGAEPVKNRK